MKMIIIVFSYQYRSCLAQLKSIIFFITVGWEVVITFSSKPFF